MHVFSKMWQINMIGESTKYKWCFQVIWCFNISLPKTNNEDWGPINISFPKQVMELIWFFSFLTLTQNKVIKICLLGVWCNFNFIKIYPNCFQAHNELFAFFEVLCSPFLILASLSQKKEKGLFSTLQKGQQLFRISKTHW